jgi:hypothetical protein
MARLLLSRFGARVTMREPASLATCVHMLIFSAIAVGVGRVKKGAAAGAAAAGEARVTEKLTRFHLEPLLELLLEASKAQGFIGDAADREAAEREQREQDLRKRSLLDEQDKQGRTPLVSQNKSGNT